jgi:hypothetical protein
LEQVEPPDFLEQACVGLDLSFDVRPDPSEYVSQRRLLPQWEGFHMPAHQLTSTGRVVQRSLVYKPFHLPYAGCMTRGRAITDLELNTAQLGDQLGWVAASWYRADGSDGEVFVQFRLATAERWYIARLLLDVPTTAKLRDVPLARIEAAVNADPKLRKWIEAAAPEEIMKKARHAAAQRPRLERPARHHLDDAFYERVAAAYRAAVANGLLPAKTLAADSDTPQGTVNRWIAESRRRGYLAPAEAGKVTV